MSAVGFDNSRLLAKLRTYTAKMPAARDAVLEGAVTEMMAEVIASEPRDTNRLVRGYMIAANQAGVGHYAVPPVKAGEFTRIARIPARLEQQLSYWEEIVSAYKREGRKDKWYNLAVRTRDRAAEELAKFNLTALVIFGGTGRNLKVTVRDKVYGGKGFRTVAAGRTNITIHNLEPHATILESKNRIVRTAFTKLKGFGVRKYGKAYLRKLGVRNAA